MRRQFIKERLQEMGKDAAWLAVECAVSVATIESCLIGRIPAKPVLKLMAQALRCAVSDLLHEEDMEPAKVG